MYTDRLHIGLLGICCLILPPVPASAEMVSIAIEAQVAAVEDPSGALDGEVEVGDVITGTYTYDSSTTDSNPLPTVGDYRHLSTPFGISLSAGSLVFETDPDNVDFLVEIVNDHGVPARDNYLLRSYRNRRLANGAHIEHISWQLDDPTSTALSSADLPATPPVLGDWQSFFGLTIEGGSCTPSGGFFIRAHVTSAVTTDSTQPRPRVEISPPSGTYVASQTTDLTIIVRPDVAFTNVHYSLDGVVLADGTAGCFRPGALPDGGRTLRCPRIHLGQVPLGPGDHDLVVRFTLADGSTVQGAAKWKVLANTEP